MNNIKSRILKKRNYTKTTGNTDKNVFFAAVFDVSAVDVGLLIVGLFNFEQRHHVKAYEKQKCRYNVPNEHEHVYLIGLAFIGMQQHFGHGIRVHDETQKGRYIISVHEPNKLVNSLMAHNQREQHTDDHQIASQRYEPHFR